MELQGERMIAELRAIEAALGRTGRSTDVLSRTMTQSFRSPLAAITALRTAVVGLGTGLAVRQVVQYADTFVQVQNQLRVAGVETEELAAATGELFDIANRTRAPVLELAQLYGRVSLAAAELGVTQQEVAGFTELVGQAIATQGASTGAVQGALLQLSQALGGSVIQMQEFNSLVDGARPLLEAAAAGIAEAEGSVQKLRQMVLDGRLSGEEFFQGMRAGADLIRQRFATTIPTVAQAMTTLNNSMTELVGGASQAGGATAELAGAITGLADTLDDPQIQDFATSIMAAIARETRNTVETFYDLWRAAQIVGDALDDMSADGEPASLFEPPDLSDLDLARNTLREIQTILEAIGQVDLAAKIAELRAPEPLEFEKGVGVFAVPRAQVTPIEAGDVESAGKGAGTGTAARKATFADIVDQLNREIALTRDAALARAGISTVLSAELRLKRELNDVERQTLIAATSTLEALEQRRDVLAEFAEINARVETREAGGGEVGANIAAAFARDLAEGGRSFAESMRQSRAALEGMRIEEAMQTATIDLQEQIQDQQTLNAFQGRETENYRAHVQMLQLKRQLGVEITREQLNLIQALERENTIARNNAAQEQARKDIRRTEFEADPRRAAVGGTFGIIGIPPPQEHLEDAIRLQNELNDVTMSEETIQRMADGQQQLQLMTETAPELANTLAQIGQIAVFEGMEEAGERFLSMLVDMLFQVLALQAVLGIFSLFGGGGGATAAIGAPTALGAFGRQRGGSVKRDQPYIVGERGAELFVPTQAGEIMSNPDTTRMLANGTAGGAGFGARAAGEAPKIVVNVQNNAPNTEARAEEGQDEQGAPRLDIFIDEMVANNLRAGTSTSRALRDRFGLQFQTRR